MKRDEFERHNTDAGFIARAKRLGNFVVHTMAAGSPYAPLYFEALDQAQQCDRLARTIDQLEATLSWANQSQLAAFVETGAIPVNITSGIE